MSKRGIIFHASYSRSGSRGNFFKSSSIRALVRVSPKLFPYLWMLSDRDERPHCQPHRTLPGQQILIRNAPGCPVRVDIQLLRKKFDCRGKVNLVFKQVFFKCCFADQLLMDMSINLVQMVRFGVKAALDGSWNIVVG